MSVTIILILFITVKLLEHGIFLILNIINLSSIRAGKSIPERFNGRVTEENFKKSRGYTIAKLNFEIIYETWDLIILFGFIYIGGFGWIEGMVAGVFGNEALMGIIFCFGISFGKEILDIPFTLYQTFVIEEKYGFNKMTPGIFFGDMGKKWLLSILLGAPVIYFLIWVIEAAGELWWIYGFGGLSIFQIFILLIYPAWIAPFFNKFTPMEAGELKEAIFNLAKKINFSISDIYIMDGSKRSSHSNAYFTGLWKNRRIVLFDTLTQLLSMGELISVLSHEMGHNKLKHIQKMIILSLGITFAGFFIWSLLLHYPALYKAFGLSGDYIFPALIIFPMIMGPVSFFISPALNYFSRKHEYESDAFAVKVSGSAQDLANALLKLNEKNLSNLTPHPLYSFFYYSHPTLAERLNAIDGMNALMSEGTVNLTAGMQ